MENKNMNQPTSSEPTKKVSWLDKLLNTGAVIKPIVLLFILIVVLGTIKIERTNSGITLKTKPESERSDSILSDAWSTLSDIKTILYYGEDSISRRDVASGTLDSTKNTSDNTEKTVSAGNASIGGSKQFTAGKIYKGFPEIATTTFYSGGYEWEEINNLGLIQIDITEDKEYDRRLPGPDGSFSWRIPRAESSQIKYVVNATESPEQEESYNLIYADGRIVEFRYDGSGIDEAGPLFLSTETAQDAVNMMTAIDGVYDTVFKGFVRNSAVLVAHYSTTEKIGRISIMNSRGGVFTISLDYKNSTVDKLKYDTMDILLGLGFESMNAPIKRIPYGRANLLADKIELYEGSEAARTIDNTDHYVN
jgi:hypothetical protein